MQLLSQTDVHETIPNMHCKEIKGGNDKWVEKCDEVGSFEDKEFNQERDLEMEERDRETDRQRQRDRDRETERGAEAQRQRDTERD